MSKFIDKTIVVGPLQCNCRLIACPKTGSALLIDPGDEAEKLIREIQATRTPLGSPIRIEYLMHTHAHFDHFAATKNVKLGLTQRVEHSAKITLHRDDEELYQHLKMQGGMFGIELDDPLPVDEFLEDAQEIKLGELKLSVLHTPGHSPGSICLRLHEDSALGVPETLFSGDTLFKESIGRSDLWGGDGHLLIKNVKNRIFTLDDDTRVCPGHGPETQVGHEKRENPFF